MSLKNSNSNVFFLAIVLMFVLLDSKYLPGGNIATIFLLINLVKKPKISISKGKMCTLFIAFASYLFLTTILHIKSNYDINNSIMYFIEIAIIVCSCHTALSQSNLAVFMKLIRNFGVVLGLLGIVEGVIKYPFLSYFLGIQCDIAYDPNGYRIVSIFGHPIVTGVFFLFCFCATLIVPYKKFFSNMIILIILILAIALTRSRSVWLSIAVMIGVILLKKCNYKNNISRKTFIRIICIVTFVVLADGLTKFVISRGIYTFFKSRIVGSLYAGEGAGNIIRIDTVLNSISYWKNGNILKFIFGMGKNYDKYFMHLFPVVKYATVWTAAIDNQYFTTIHEAGVMGLIPIILIVIYAVQRIIRIDIKNRISLVANAGIVGIYVSMFFFEGLNYMSVLTMLIILFVISDQYEKVIV